MAYVEQTGRNGVGQRAQTRRAALPPGAVIFNPRIPRILRLFPLAKALDEAVSSLRPGRSLHSHVRLGSRQAPSPHRCAILSSCMALQWQDKSGPPVRDPAS